MLRYISARYVIMVQYKYDLEEFTVVYEFSDFNVISFQSLETGLKMLIYAHIL